MKTGSSLNRVEDIDEEIIDLQEDQDGVTALTTSEEDQSRLEVYSGPERKQLPYFKVISPVPSLSVSSLKADSPQSDGLEQLLTSEEEDREQTVTSDEDREFEEPLNNNVQSNSTESPDTSTQRFLFYLVKHLILISHSWRPQPERQDFFLSSSLPRLNTVANFTEKKIISYSPAKEKPVENSVDEAALDNIRNEILEEYNKKPVNTEFNDVWANFDSKKIISCNPRPTLDEIYLDHRRPQPPHTEARRESLEKKVVFQDAKRRKALEKEEEYCLNLGIRFQYIQY